MSEAKHCPHCGALLGIDGGHPSVETSAEVETSATEAAEFPDQLPDSADEIPSMPLLAPGSNDDTFMTPSFRKVVAAEPDPILGAFVATGSPVGSSVSAESGISKPVTPSRSGSSAFPTINFDSPANPSTVGRVPIPQPRPVEPEIEDDDDEEEAEPPRSGWSSVLLASYASAMTIALAWYVIHDRNREKSGAVETPTVEQGPQPPTNADRSRKVQPPEPIEGDHLVRLKQPLKIGSLEITPIDVTRKDVKTQRKGVVNEFEFRDRGKNALVLRLKIRNTSEDTVFAPLDPAYLREDGDKLVDTFVTTASGERIYPFPLAIESEWSIVGQNLSELRPGESRTVAIVTRPDAPTDDAGPFTWRVRLRTGINRTDIIGLTWPEPVEAKPESKK